MGKFAQTHIPCDKCGSSDAASIDHEGWTYCFSCGASYKEGGYTVTEEFRSLSLLQGEYTPLVSRGLTEETCRRFGYEVGNGKHIANYRRRTGKVASQHIREKGKKFYWVNYLDNLELFGQHLWKQGGKSLIITEGEIDAMCWAQTREHKWPVVAIPGTGNGASFIAANLEFVSSFEEIYLSFDMDEPGRKLAEDIAPLLPAGKVRVISLPEKDACDVMNNQGAAALYKTLWQAKVWLPEEIIDFTSALELGMDTDRRISTGISVVDNLIGLLAPGNMVMIGAGSNIGKSLLIKHLCASMTQQFKCAFFPLEEGAGTVARQLAAIPTLNPDNLIFYNESGRDLLESIPNQIEYLSKGQGVEVVFIDHITAIFNKSGADLKSIDTFLQRLQSIGNRLGVLFIYNSHVKDSAKGDYMTGEMITASSFRGSGMLFRIPHVVIGLARDTENEETKHISKLKVLKHREEGLLVGNEAAYTLSNGQIVDDDINRFNTEDTESEF